MNSFVNLHNTVALASAIYVHSIRISQVDIYSKHAKLPPSHVIGGVMHLSGGHGLGNKTLEGKLLLLQVLSSAVLKLKSSHGVAHLGLNLVLLATLQLEGEGLVGDDLLNTADVGLELLLSLEALAESLIVALEVLGIADHLLDLSGGELTNRVGDGDVGAAARGLLGGSDLEDTVDVDLEDTLKDGLTGTHGGDRSKGEFTQGGVVLAVDTLTLIDRELNGLLVVGNSGESTLKTVSKLILQSQHC
mgnify:CR=1 FL=1